MTEANARKTLQKKLHTMTDDDAPNVWIGPLVVNAPSAFVFEGGIYAANENPRDVSGFCAVNKKSGASGLILPPPGPPLEANDLEDFNWDEWVIA